MAAAYHYVATETCLDFARLTFPQLNCLLAEGKPKPSPYPTLAEVKTWASS